MNRTGSLMAFLSRSRLFALLALLLVETSATAQVGQPPDSPRTALFASPALRRQLQSLDDLARQQRWAEAVPEYQRLTLLRGDELVPVDATEELYWPLRKVCQQRLHHLPEPGRREAKLLVSRAATWFAEGTTRQDWRTLRRIVDEAACSPFYAPALHLLGDAAFYQGDYAEAERTWHKALPHDHDPCHLEAKILLAQLAQGEGWRFAAGFHQFTARHGTREGKLAGRHGRYAEILRHQAAEKASHDNMPQLQPLRWRHLGTLRQHVRLVPEQLLGLGRLLCHDDQRLYALDVESVQTQEWRNLAELLPSNEVAILKHVAVTPSGILLTVQTRTHVILFALEGKPRGRVLWRCDLPGTLRAAPCLDAERLFVLVQGGNESAVHARSLLTGDVCWLRPLPSAAPITSGFLQRTGNCLVVYHAPIGLLALETEAGRVCWLRRMSLPSPAHCIATAQEIIVAPAQDDRVWRLDVQEGKVFWQSTTMAGPQLVGSAPGRIIVNTGQDMRALEQRSGQVLWRTQVPPRQGRACLQGERLFWPSAEGVRILNLGDGELLDDPRWQRRLAAGELLLWGDILVSVSPSALQIYRRQP